MCGGGSSDSSGTTNQNTSFSTNGTSTPNTPAWLSQPWQDFVKNVGGLPNYTVNGPSSLQTQAFGAASNLGESPYFGQASGLLGSGTAGYSPATMSAAQVGPVANANATSAAGGVGAYLNPYQANVNNNLINEMERSRELATTSNGQGAVAAGQYGGSRQGVLDANTNRDYFQQLGTALSNADVQSYQNSLDAAQQDANRDTNVSLANAGAANQAGLTQAGLTQGANSANQSALNTGSQFNLGSQLTGAGLAGGLGTASGNQQIANIGLLGDLGSTQYGIGQNQATAPYVGAGLLSSLLGSVPSNMFVGQTTTNNGTGTMSGTTTGHQSKSPGLFDWLSMMGGNMSKAAGAAAGA